MRPEEIRRRLGQWVRTRMAQGREGLRILWTETPQPVLLAVGKRLGLGCAGLLLTAVLAASGLSWQGWLGFLLLPLGFFLLAYHLARACARGQVMALTGTLTRSGRVRGRNDLYLRSHGQTIRIPCRGRPARRAEMGGTYTLYLLRSTRVRRRREVFTLAGYVALAPAEEAGKGGKTP